MQIQGIWWILRNEILVYGQVLCIFLMGQVCSPFATNHYVAAYKIMHMYYLKKSHDSLNRSCD